MITEDYVSFEVAKLLKEKGFSENTEHESRYVIKQFSTGCHWNSCTYKVGSITREYNDDCCISMPTLQMAMKWLREVHKISIEITSTGYLIDNDVEWECDIKAGHRLYFKHITCEKSFESCENEAIKYCLENLI